MERGISGLPLELKDLDWIRGLSCGRLNHISLLTDISAACAVACGECANRQINPRRRVSSTRQPYTVSLSDRNPLVLPLYTASARSARHSFSSVPFTQRALNPHPSTYGDCSPLSLQSYPLLTLHPPNCLHNPSPCSLSFTKVTYQA